MSSLNPFYRFTDAPLAGPMSASGRRLSEITQELFNQLNVSFAGQKVSELLAQLQSDVASLNQLSGANFVVDLSHYFIIGSAPHPFQLFVYEASLVSMYPLMKISIAGQTDSVGDITANVVSFLGLLPDDYAYSDPLFKGEIEAYHALKTYNDTGAAIFPTYYTFDYNTGIATSLMPRFKDCKFDVNTGQAVRSVEDQNPRGQRPFFKAGTQSKAGKYIIGLFDQLIQIARDGGTFAEVTQKYFSWLLPTGYSLMDYYDTTPDRCQVVVFKTGGGEAYSIVIRDDSGITFQRFYAPDYSPTNLLTTYPGSNQLPYEPNDLYFRCDDVLIDYEFCEFDNCQYPPKEIYRMPIHSGDQLRFNVPDYTGNVMPYINAQVGIFDQNLGLIGNVGEAIKTEPVTLVMRGLWFGFPVQTPQSYAAFYALFSLVYEEISIDFFLADCNGNKSGDVLASIAPGTLPDNFADFKILYESLPWPDYITATVVEDSGSLLFTYVIVDAPVCYCMVQWGNATLNPNINTTQGIIRLVDPIQLHPAATQFRAEALIPAIADGCYRLGLYNFQNQQTQRTTIWTETTFEIPENAFFAFANISDSNFAYVVAIPKTVTNLLQFSNWIKATFPLAIVNYETSGADSLTVSMCPYNDLLQTLDVFPCIGTYDFDLEEFTTSPIDEFSTESCGGDGHINEIYSLSNILDLDDAECFSSIIKFWSAPQSLVAGWEYNFDGWYQQVRLGINGGGAKPKIEEATYRQSNGVHRRPQNKQDLSVDLHTDFLDLETQSALVDATRHSNFVFQDKNLFVNGDIEVATIQDFSTESSFEDLAQVKFSALIQGYQPKSSTCINC